MSGLSCVHLDTSGNLKNVITSLKQKKLSFFKKISGNKEISIMMLTQT